jgi:hypothetical protein
MILRFVASILPAGACLAQNVNSRMDQLVQFSAIHGLGARGSGRPGVAQEGLWLTDPPNPWIVNVGARGARWRS